MDTFQVLINLFFAFIGAYLSVLLSKLLKQNGRVLEKMDEGFKLIARLIVEENEKTRKEILQALSGK